MVSWEEAEKHCVEEHEGHIASVTSQQIHEFLLKIMKQKQKYYMTSIQNRQKVFFQNVYK